MFKFAERAKAYAALVGAVLSVFMASTGFALVPEKYQPYFGAVLAVATAVATFKIPNAPSVPKVTDEAIRTELLGDE